MINRPKGCVFCEAIKAGSGPESLLLYHNDHAMVIMNKFPYNTGHLLVLPRRHCGDLLQLDQAERHAMSDLLHHAVQAVTDVYQPGGLNIGVNHGAVAGAGIPEHLHYHVVPRWAGDTNFFPLIAQTKVVIETLEQTFARLRPYFQSL
jgi:ATP adenylyltransferase